MTENQEEKSQVQFSFGQKAAVFAPAALTAIGADVALHAPLPLAAAGLVGAFFLAKKSPEIYGALRGYAPLPEIKAKPVSERKPGEWTLGDRLMGRHLQEPSQADEPAPQEIEEPEDVPTQRMKQPVAALFDNYPEDETLRLGRVLATGERFEPHIDGLFGKGLIASAVQGSGKSTLNRVIIEQAGKCGVPVVVFDHKGEYAPITDLPFVQGMRAGSDVLQANIGPSCFRLIPENADKFVARVMENRSQAIIDLPSYGDGWLERAEIVAAVGQALMRWSARQRQVGGVLLPCLVFLDEAQLYIPQNVNLLPPEAQKNREVLDSLSNAYFSLVSNGRSNGYTVCFSTQSLTYIAKWAIKSCQVKVFGRHTEKNDLDMCEQIISSKVASREDIETFAPGVAVVFGFTPQAMVIRFDKSQSRDISETPGIQRLRQRQSIQQPPDSGNLGNLLEANNLTVDDLLKALLERMPDVDPYDARYQNTEPEQPVVREQVAQQQYYRPVADEMPGLPPTQRMEPLYENPVRRSSSALPLELQQALKAYEPGMSYRDLAKVLGIGKDTAGKRIEELRRRKLI